MLTFTKCGLSGVHVHGLNRCDILATIFYLCESGNMDRKLKEIDIRSYAKYILLEGTKQEKRDLLECLKSKIYLKDKTIYLI